MPRADRTQPPPANPFRQELIAKSTEMTLPPRDTDTYTPPPKARADAVPAVFQQR